MALFKAFRGNKAKLPQEKANKISKTTTTIITQLHFTISADGTLIADAGSIA